MRAGLIFRFIGAVFREQASILGLFNKQMWENMLYLKVDDKLGIYKEG